jgi:hypothetical protein
MLVGAVAAVVGGIVLVLGVMSRHPERAWWAYQTNFMFWAGLAQGMVVFGATQKLAKGHWSGVIIRFAEANVAFTTVTLVLFFGLIIGRNYIFTWIQVPRPEVGWWLSSKWFLSATAPSSLFCRGCPGGSCGTTWPPTYASWRAGSLWSGRKMLRAFPVKRHFSSLALRLATVCSASI